VPNRHCGADQIKQLCRRADSGIARREDHHPDMRISFNWCHLLYTTHTINGLSHNDFICAAHIDAVL
jgi:pterin-4a-carbinolamine dehydratase